MSGAGLPRAEPSDKEKRIEKAAPWLLTATALGLRLFRLDQDSLWFDEAYTALKIAQPPGQILEVLGQEISAPLYYLVMHLWAPWAGEGEFALRLPSALLGAAAVPLLYWVGCRMFSRRAGLIAASVAVLSPVQLHYSRELRMYSMVALLAIAVLYSFHRLLMRPTLGKALIAGVLATLGLYLHYFFLFLLPLAGLALLAPNPRRAWKGAAMALLVVALGFAPWLPKLLDQSSSPANEWIDVMWETTSIFYAVPWSLESLGPTALYPPYAPFKFAPVPLGRLLSLGAALAVLAGAIRLVARRWPLAEARAMLITLAALMTPLVGALVVSLTLTPVYVVARYDLIAWGSYCLAVGAVLAGLGTRAAVVTTAAWILLSALTLRGYWTTPRLEVGTKIAAHLTSRADPGDVIIFAAGSRTTTEFYLHEARSRFRLVSYPMSNDAHLGWIDLRVFSDRRHAAAEARHLALTLRGWEPSPQAVWVAGSGAAKPVLVELARMGYRRQPARSTELILCLER